MSCDLSVCCFIQTDNYLSTVMSRNFHICVLYFTFILLFLNIKAEQHVCLSLNVIKLTHSVWNLCFLFPNSKLQKNQFLHFSISTQLLNYTHHWNGKPCKHIKHQKTTLGVLFYISVLYFQHGSTFEVEKELWQPYLSLCLQNLSPLPTCLSI